MSDRIDTIARMACDLRIADGMAATHHIHTEYIAEAIALYQQTERAVTEAFRTESTPLPCRTCVPAAPCPRCEQEDA